MQIQARAHDQAVIRGRRVLSHYSEFTIMWSALFYGKIIKYACWTYFMGIFYSIPMWLLIHAKREPVTYN